LWILYYRQEAKKKLKRELGFKRNFFAWLGDTGVFLSNDRQRENINMAPNTCPLAWQMDWATVLPSMGKETPSDAQYYT